MLPVYLDNISLDAIKKINKKIDGMLDHVYDMSDDLTCFEYIEYLFPECRAGEDPNWCVKTLKQFRSLVNDDYLRDYLEPKYEYILFQLLHWHIDLAKEEGEDVTLHYENYNEDEDIPDEAYIEALDSYLDILFQDYDFLSLPGFLTSAARPNILTDMMGVDIDEYVELMPEDIRRRYLETCLQEESGIKLNEDIINTFQKAICEIEAHPTLYKDYNESEINDLISSMIKLYLSSMNITVTREAPRGYAFKNKGEVDFFLFESSSNKSIAIGESKDANLFSKAIKQLLGYMNRETQFGFTININRTKTVDEVKNRIVNTLEEFKANTEFETIKIAHNDDYIMSLHRMPEDSTKRIFLYHLILNFSTDARRDIAKQARRKEF